MNKYIDSTVIGPLLAFIIVIAVVGTTTDGFFDTGNLTNLTLQVSVVSIVAIGSTIVILTGGIDLSPGSMIALISMMLAIAIKKFEIPLLAAIALSLVLGGALGSLNGLFSAYLRIPSFIATLAALSAFRGLAFIPTNGSPIFSLSDHFSQLFYGSFFGLPLPFFYLTVAYTGAYLFLGWLPSGREVYAIGGNPTAARLSGINVRRVQFLAFVLSGIASAIGAVLFAARLNSGSPNYGSGMELQAIAASVIGGASLAGGRGHILGTLLGASIIIVVQNAMNLNGISSSLQAVIIGTIILIAVGIDRWQMELGLALVFFVPKPLRSNPRRNNDKKIA